MLVGLTLTTEIFLASFNLACSCLSSSLANMAGIPQRKGKTGKEVGDFMFFDDRAEK